VATRDDIRDLQMRALGVAVDRTEAALRTCEDRLSDVLGELKANRAESSALKQEVALLRVTYTSHPAREAWQAFLISDWKGKAAVILPLVLLAYAMSVGEPLPALATEILTTARLCATGQRDPHAGP
jgi:hypothetical protein